MPRVKLLLVASLAVFMFMPALATASTGGQWLVNGKALLAGETLALLPKALVLRPKEGVLKVLVAGGSIEVGCEGEQVDLEEGKIIGPDGILVKKLTFHLCKILNSASCTLGSELLSTVPIHGLASLDLPGSLNAYILLLPETKNTLATIKFEGETCAILGTQSVTGNASLLIHGALHEVLSHLVLAFSLPKALKFGSSEADLEKIDFDLVLSQHENWSFH
jgi:hypothetical protein